MPRKGSRWRLFKALALVACLLGSSQAFALTVMEVARDLACPCQCPLILEDCNMTCGLEWKGEVGEMIAKGMNKQEIIDYFVATYGESARLTTLQRIEGKIFQYTRGFGTTEWVLLWLGLGFWTVLVFVGFYFVVSKLFFGGRNRIAASGEPEFSG